jgi:hypothetical protein
MWLMMSCLIEKEQEDTCALSSTVRVHAPPNRGTIDMADRAFVLRCGNHGLLLRIDL